MKRVRVEDIISKKESKKWSISGSVFRFYGRHCSTEGCYKEGKYEVDGKKYCRLCSQEKLALQEVLPSEEKEGSEK